MVIQKIDGPVKSIGQFSSFEGRVGKKEKKNIAMSVIVGRGVKQIEFLGKMCPNNSI